MKLNVPFFSNTSDNTHCFQAGIKMVLKFFEPNKDYNFEELDRLSAKKEGLWTWPTAMTLNLYNMGYEVIAWEDFDYQSFIDNPEQYLFKKCGEEVAKEQIAYSDLAQEKGFMREFMRIGTWKRVIPTQNDIKKFLRKGFLVCCNVNAKTLNHKNGYEGHFVIVIGWDNDGLILHDPGLPPRKNRHVDQKTFEKSWAYPTPDFKSIMAIKKLQ